MKPVVIEREAERELFGAADFYERRRSGLGLEFESAAREAVRMIQADPARYAMQKNGTRRRVMSRFPFIVHYVDLPDAIWIVAFAHANRKPNYWASRLPP